MESSGAKICGYVEQNKPCRDTAAGELRAHFYKRSRAEGGNDGEGWPMCSRHIKPEMHPPDLRDKLIHWATAA